MTSTSVKSRRTEDEKAKEAEELAQQTFITLDLLMEFGLWVASNKLRDNERKRFDYYEEAGQDLVLEKKRFANFYTVNIDAKKTWEEIYSWVEINLRHDEEVVFYRGDKNDAIVAYVPKPPRGIYSYPPKSVESLLFYLVNPEIEAEAIRLAEEAGISPEAIDKIQTLQAILSKLPGNLSDVEIEREKDDFTPIKARARVLFEEAFKVLSTIEAKTMENDEYRDYKVGFNNNGVLVYTISTEDYADYTRALEVLFEKLAPVDEMKTARKILKNIEAIVLRVYLVLKASEKANSEYGLSAFSSDESDIDEEPDSEDV